MNRHSPFHRVNAYYSILCPGAHNRHRLHRSLRSISIGAVVSMTGLNSKQNIGNNMWQSAVLATDEINANGGNFCQTIQCKNTH